MLFRSATVRGGRAGRTTLADMLWPDSPDGRALGSLRQALTTLRIKFGPEVIRTTDGILAFGNGVDVDARMFVDALDNNQFEAAVALYHGHFIETAAEAISLPFSHWAATERQRLRSAYFVAGSALLRQYLEAQLLPKALSLSEQLTRLAPNNDTIWIARFDALMAAGEDGHFLTESSWLRAERAAEGVPITETLARCIANHESSVRLRWKVPAPETRTDRSRAERNATWSKTDASQLPSSGYGQQAVDAERHDRDPLDRKSHV